MSILRFLAPIVCTLFGIYCIIWGLVAPSSPVTMRIGGAFIGVLLLLLAVVYIRIIVPYERAQSR
ncbi:MAG: hypothetical protein J2P37_14935 [Ktedonobacteraceae bacterium]|nr:hypothetical protein [Ktedonobacteraceae bacterium]MBO0790445.1 hypothetical protein [Ktedonobacteraceae bacterium]